MDLRHSTRDLTHQALVDSLVHRCHERLGRPLDAAELDDARQETWLEVWKAAASYRGEGTPESWIYSIARHTILRVWRSRARQQRHEQPLGDEALQEPTRDRSPATAVDTGLVRFVRAGLAAEGETLMAILLAREEHHRGFPSIARELEMTESAVKSRYYRAIPDLRRRFQGLWRDLH